MKIRSLALTKRPVWIDFGDSKPRELCIRATARFWPANVRGAALFVFEFVEAVPEGNLSENKISMSSIGPFVYLDAPADSGVLEQTIALPDVKLNRIGIRLWNTAEPILLEDIAISVAGANVRSEYESDHSIVLREIGGFRNLPQDKKVLGLNLLTSRHDCSARCHAICQHWYTTMDDVARRYRDADVERTNCWFEADGGDLVPITVFHGRPAMLHIPSDFSTYLEEIGDKSRNMIRKAQRLGYLYKKVDPNQYLDDVLAIRTSAPLRQGKPLPDYFKVRPAQMFEPPFQNDCEVHREEFYGIFKGECLVAYSTIFLYGELGQINHILGHKEHLSEGVMNLLVSEIVRDFISNRPWIRAVNYLYADAVRRDGGLGLFKRSTGFLPETVVVTQSNFDLNRHFRSREAAVVDAPAQASSVKKALKAGTAKAVKEATAAESFIRPDKFRNRALALGFALHKLGESEPKLKTIRYLCGEDDVAESDFDPSAMHAVVFDDVKFESYQDFLSLKLKGFRKVVPKGSFVLFDFKCTHDSDYVTNKGRLGMLIPRVFQSRGRRINEALTEYLSKRFKSLDMSADDVKLGFKGSDYVVAGLIDYSNTRSYRSFDSLLILRKIR